MNGMRIKNAKERKLNKWENLANNNTLWYKISRKMEKTGRGGCERVEMENRRCGDYINH